MSVDFNKFPSIHVGDLIEALDRFPKNYTIDFCGLRFKGVYPVGDHHVQLEFDQAVYPDDAGNVTVVNLEE